MIAVDCVLDAKAKLGEAAVWCDRQQVLYWVDIEGCALHRFDPVDRDDQSWPMPSRIGCFALRERGGFVVALENGFSLFDAETGDLEHLQDPEADKPNNRFNDGTTDPVGRLIAGTMPMGPRAPVGAFWRLHRDGSVMRLFDALTVTNGTAFSPDGRTFYFADSESSVRTIWACDYDPDDGAVANRRVFADTHGMPGRPDGGTVDADGCYWMAGVGGWQLVRFTPDGRIDRTIDLPCEKPTKVAFGDRGLDTLYVTSIGEGLTSGSEGRQPQAGGIFALRVPGVRGLPVLRFAG